MEWIEKVISWIKLPFKMIVLALWSICFGMLFLPDNYLARLYLLDSRDTYGSLLGLSFAITSSLLAAYILLAIINYTVALYGRITFPKKVQKAFENLSDSEQGLLLSLFFEPDHVLQLDMNNPLVQGLASRKMIHWGGQQFVGYDYHTDTYPMKYTLQPFVLNYLTKEFQHLEKKTKRAKKKLKKCMNERKRESLTQEIGEAEKMLTEWRRN